MSINNCQAIQKSCIARSSNAWFTSGNSAAQSRYFEAKRAYKNILEYNNVWSMKGAKDKALNKPGFCEAKNA